MPPNTPADEARPPTLTSPRGRFLLGLLLFAFTSWLYAPAVGGGFLTRMDDDEYLAQAARVHGLGRGGLHWAFTTFEPYFHPLPRLSFLLDYSLWGANPAGWHAVNAWLHALNAACLFGLLWALLGARTSWRPRERCAAAFAAAAVFAVHPLQVESVAWIASRVQLLCTLFEIACLWACLAGARRWIIALLFAGALLCKPTAISLLFAILAIDALVREGGAFERGGWARRLLGRAELILLAGIAAAMTLLTEAHPGGLLQPLQAVGPLQRAELVVQSLAFYPSRLVWPAALCPYYPLGLGFSLRTAAVAAACLGVLAAAALALAARRRAPALTAALAVYALFILPISGLALRGWQAAADRYAYVAVVPLLLAAAGGAVWLWRRAGPAARPCLGCLGAAGIVLLAARTRLQIPVWHDDLALWRAVVARYPDSAAANEMLAQVLLNKGEIHEALACAASAAQDQPCAETLRNLGIALTQAGRPADAVHPFEEAIRRDPTLADTRHHFALALVSLGRIDEAIRQWEQTVRIRPDYTEAQCDLGVALEQAGRLAESADHYEQALRLRPELAGVHYNFGNVLLGLHRESDAVAQWRESLRLDPNNASAHYNLGVVLEHQGRTAEALAHYREAVRIRPHFQAAQRRLLNLVYGY